MPLTQKDYAAAFYASDSPSLFYYQAEDVLFTLAASQEGLTVTTPFYTEDFKAALQAIKPVLLSKEGALVTEVSRREDCLRVHFALTEETGIAQITKELADLALLLKANGLAPHACAFCREEAHETAYLNGIWSPAHIKCAKARQQGEKENNRGMWKGFLLAAAFTVVLAGFWYLFARWGVMPSLAAILMGAGAAFALRLFGKTISKKQLLYMTLGALAVVVVANTLTDYFMLAHLAYPNGLRFLYTLPVNQFNVLFDVLSGIALYAVTLYGLTENLLLAPLHVQYSKTAERDRL